MLTTIHHHAKPQELIESLTELLTDPEDKPKLDTSGFSKLKSLMANSNKIIIK